MVSTQAKTKPGPARESAGVLRVVPVAAPVRAQVVANLRAAILSGRFPPGARLVEATMCELLQVSRTSLREALRQLEAEKLVTITPFAGPTVTRMTLEDAEQIYAVRVLLEGHAARLFAVRATGADIAAMKSALAGFERAMKSDDAVARVTSTSDFYDVILRGCGNRVILEMLEGLHARINYLRSRSMSSPARSVESLKELKAMLHAIENQSPAQAEKAARLHVARARDAAKKVLAAP